MAFFKFLPSSQKSPLVKMEKKKKKNAKSKLFNIFTKVCYLEVFANLANFLKYCFGTKASCWPWEASSYIFKGNAINKQINKYI